MGVDISAILCRSPMHDRIARASKAEQSNLRAIDCRIVDRLEHAKKLNSRDIVGGIRE
jgi:hypothetical protein